MLLHVINVQSASGDVSWQVDIGLHQFDNCLSQVKINTTTLNNSCFFPYLLKMSSS